jgi:hypothetical protein
MRLYLNKTFYKKWVGEVAQDVGPEFKSQYHKKKKGFSSDKLNQNSQALTFKTK